MFRDHPVTSGALHGRDFAADRRIGFLAAIGVIIGVIGTLSAIVLLAMIHLFTNLFYFHSLSFVTRSPAHSPLGVAALLVPVIGGLLVGLLARFGSEKIRGHGIPEAIEAILFGKSRMSAKVAILKPLSSGIAIGSGGPFGAEGPVIMTGGSCASLLAQALHVTAAERKGLLVAGACAGMTAVFGTPVAAILLAVELLLFELRPRSLVPVSIACAVAAFLRSFWTDVTPLFPVQTDPVGTVALLSCVAAGLITGAVSALMTWLLYRIEDLFARLPLHWMWWPALGGLAVGLGGLWQPRALGVGYDVIADLLQNHLVLTAAVSLLIVKMTIWLLALGSGTSGGVLAPLLMIGASVGCVLAPWLGGGSPSLWALACMAAMLAGTMRAPLTAVVFGLELTHDLNALMPTLLTCVCAYGLTVVVMPRSILTEKIARRGRHVFREYGVDPLERHFVDEVMTREVIAVDASISAQQLLTSHFGPGQRHRAYPVTDQGQLVGMVDRAALEAWPAQARQYPLSRLLNPQLANFALPNETCRAAAHRMASQALERLPVVDAPETRRLVGIVSRSDLLKPARLMHEEEHQRESHFGDDEDDLDDEVTSAPAPKPH